MATTPTNRIAVQQLELTARRISSGEFSVQTFSVTPVTVPEPSNEPEPEAPVVDINLRALRRMQAGYAQLYNSGSGTLSLTLVQRETTDPRQRTLEDRAALILLRHWARSLRKNQLRASRTALHETPFHGGVVSSLEISCEVAS